jgi:hypothetical protein
LLFITKIKAIHMKINMGKLKCLRFFINGMHKIAN